MPISLVYPIGPWQAPPSPTPLSSACEKPSTVDVVVSAQHTSCADPNRRGYSWVGMLWQLSKLNYSSFLGAFSWARHFELLALVVSEHSLHDLISTNSFERCRRPNSASTFESTSNLLEPVGGHLIVAKGLSLSQYWRQLCHIFKYCDFLGIYTSLPLVSLEATSRVRSY